MNPQQIDDLVDSPIVEAASGDAPLEMEVGGRAVRLLADLWAARRYLRQWLLAGFLAGVLLAVLLPARYQATVRLMPPEGQNSELALAAALSGRLSSLGLGTELLGMRSSAALIVGVLRSDRVSDSLIDRFDLATVYRTRTREDTRRVLADYTEVFEDRRSGIVRVTMTDTDPNRVAAMVNAYADELNRALSEVTTSAAGREREFLEERLQHVSAELEKATRQFSQFASEHGAIDIQEQGRAMVEAGATLQGTLIAAEAELQGLLAIYTSENVRVRAVRARIAELRRQRDEVAGVSQVEGPSRPTAYPSLRELPRLSVAYFELYRNAKVQEAVYEALVQKYEIAKVQEVREVPNVRVLDQARPPQKRSGPRRVLLVMAMTALGFFLGAMLTVSASRWRQRPPNDPLRALVRDVQGTARMSWRQQRESARNRSRWRRRSGDD